MNSIYIDIFKAIHEGKWLKIEYRNRDDQVTKYWIGIRDLDPVKRTLAVDGLHLSKYTTDSYDYIYIDSIISSQIVEGSYYPVNEALTGDIDMNPHRYKKLFDNTANLKILNYLEMCNKLDCVPYYSNFELVRYLDGESFAGGICSLDDEQFATIVKHFQYKMSEKPSAGGRITIKQLAMNVLSIYTEKGLYVLAYRKLQFDVKSRALRPEPQITICTEFMTGGARESIRKYLDADEYELLEDFEANRETIEDCIMKNLGRRMELDDRPYVIGLGMDVAVDLHGEYQAIMDMYHEDRVTVPIKAFFGDLLSRPRRRKSYPIMLKDNKINLDQLLAINNAMKYPAAYVQGPPGTGKTNTIINTIITAFFNEKTVLFTSYNNYPIDGVFKKLITMKYKEKDIPFPVLRLGNSEKLREAIEYINDIYDRVKDIPIYSATLGRKKDGRIEQAKKLSELLKSYEEILDLRERRETLAKMLEHQGTDTESMRTVLFRSSLQSQLKSVESRIEGAGEITDREALELLDPDFEQLMQYLYFTSAGYIKKLGSSRYEDLRQILSMEDEEKQLAEFSKYLKDEENIRKLSKVFPIMITTCISAHKLGEPTPKFDMVIMDEASQCNTAVALVPVIRGDSLMLVGDPQQLNPVIMLDEAVNRKLRKDYDIADEYDYRMNSVYKTFLACDAVSDEVLLRNHYRCHEKIIGFNNRKYYNSKLNICSESREQQPLVYIDVRNELAGVKKNTAPEEVDAIIRYADRNRDKQIGVITPFVNQKQLIEEELNAAKLDNVACGTVHAFQGDEKDVILFSTTLTDKTYAGTYNWLKNNKELINVATSRARDKLIVLADSKNLSRLHDDEEDDLFELVEYVKENGNTQVTRKEVNSRALGVKPFSTKTEDTFLNTLNHALENIWQSGNRYKIRREVAIAHVFGKDEADNDLFYSGRFDFVVYERRGGAEYAVLAIELDGKEHFTDEAVKRRDRKKAEICRAHQMELIRVENSYARRYNHIKEILTDYFSVRKRQ